MVLGARRVKFFWYGEGFAKLMNPCLLVYCCFVCPSIQRLRRTYIRRLKSFIARAKGWSTTATAENLAFEGCSFTVVLETMW